MYYVRERESRCVMPLATGCRCPTRLQWRLGFAWFVASVYAVDRLMKSSLLIDSAPCPLCFSFPILFHLGLCLDREEDDDVCMLFRYAPAQTEIMERSLCCFSMFSSSLSLSLPSFFLLLSLSLFVLRYDSSVQSGLVESVNKFFTDEQKRSLRLRVI